MEKIEVAQRLRDARVLLILDGERVVEAVRAAVDAGVWAVEVDVSEGVEPLRRLVEEQLGCVPGAGGVRAAQEAWDAIEAGAKFLSAAPLDAEIAAVCEAAGVATIAVVDGLPAAEAALPLRPDFLRFPASLGIAPPEGPGAVMELGNADPAEVALLASTVAVRESALGAGSAEDLGRRLAEIARAVQAAA